MKWEENVRKVVPYVAGEQPNRPNMIKLNTNECPYPPAPGVRKAAENMESAALRLYPDSNAQPLVDALAAYYDVKPEQVFVGVGSDDVLSMAFMTFFNSGKPILFPDVTYSFYDVWAEMLRIPYETMPLFVRPVCFFMKTVAVAPFSRWILQPEALNILGQNKMCVTHTFR